MAVLLGTALGSSFGEPLSGAFLGSNFVEQDWGAALYANFEQQLGKIAILGTSLGGTSFRT